MTRRPAESAEIEALAAAWAAADDAQAGEGGDRQASTERIWRAVSDELPPDELRALAVAVAADPELARTWRLARELGAGEQRPAESAAPRRIFRREAPARVWALAALLLAAIGILYWLPNVRSAWAPVAPTLRGAEPETRLAPRIADGARLARGSFVLRWSAATNPAAVYSLRITTADLALVAEADDIAATELALAAEALAAWPAGTKLYWRVEARAPDGRTETSPLSMVVLVD